MGVKNKRYPFQITQEAWVLKKPFKLREPLEQGRETGAE